MERPAKSGLAEASPLVFELLAEIATGPTARVELCRIGAPREQAGKLVAVKRLHPHIAEDPQFYSMFVDEVWMTAALDHPNVTHVVGWGSDREGTFLAVELVEGVSLARLMKTVFETREAFTERMVVHLGAEICAGLAAAHRLRSADGELLQLVHRDLTPGNVLVGFDGRVLIADFGLAKAKQRVTKTLTGLLKGHPHYMAPEQATEQPIDARADLFSLGVVLFELFTGRHPWSGGSELEVFQLMASAPPEDISALRPKLDRELVGLVNRLLAKRPQDRFQSADEVRDRLLYWLDTHGYKEDNVEAVARFVRRNAMRQMRWFERAINGDFVAEATRSKAKLLGVRGRREESTGPKSSPPSGPAPSGSRAAVMAQAGPRRRAAMRRAIEEPTDVDVRASSIESPPSGETPDWGEEIPTVVQPNRQLAALHADRLGGGLARGGPIPPAASSDPTSEYTRRGGERDPSKARPERSAIDALPSFVDDEDSSDIRTTSVQPQVGLAAFARTVRYGRGEAPGRDAPAREPVLDPPSEDVPTSPLRARPELPSAPPLRKMPPPKRPKPPSAPAPEPRRAPLETDTEPEILTEPVHPKTIEAVKRDTAEPSDIVREAERLAQRAAQLRARADQAAKLAAHHAVLAQLGAEAAELAAQAARSFHAHGAVHAMTLIEEARRLEASVARGEAQTDDLIAPSADPPASKAELARQAPDRVSAPPPEPVAVAPAAAFPAPVGPGYAPSFPPVVAPAAPADRPSYLPALPAPLPAPVGGPLEGSGRLPSSLPTAHLDTSAPLATSPSSATSPTATDQGMFAGEVFGVRVPIALAAAFLIAVAMVVLVWVIVS